jgi:hypothetical protein
MYHGHHERIENGPRDGDFAAYVDRLCQPSGTTKRILESAKPERKAKKGFVERNSANLDAKGFGRQPVPQPVAPTLSPPDLDELLLTLRRRLVPNGKWHPAVWVLGIAVIWLFAIFTFDYESGFNWIPLVLLFIGFRLLRGANRNSALTKKDK